MSNEKSMILFTYEGNKVYIFLFTDKTEDFEKTKTVFDNFMSTVKLK